MSEIKPFCPYCGAEMKLLHTGRSWWYRCSACVTESPDGNDAKEALLKALHRASPWHSVKEGLPKDGTICVVHGYSEGGAEGYGIAPCTMTGWSGVGVTTFEVTHWMPVPDVPKEAEK